MKNEGFMMENDALHSLPNIIEKMKNEGLFCDQELLFEMWKNGQIEMLLDWRNKGYTNSSGTKKYDEIVRPRKKDIFYIKEHGLDGEHGFITELIITPTSSGQTELASLERPDPNYGIRIDFNSLNELAIEAKYLKVIKKSLKNSPMNPHGNKKRFEDEKNKFLIKARHVLDCHIDECIGAQGRVTQEKLAEATMMVHENCPDCKILITSTIDTAKRYIRKDPHIMNMIKKQG